MFQGNAAAIRLKPLVIEAAGAVIFKAIAKPQTTDLTETDNKKPAESSTMRVSVCCEIIGGC